MIELRLQETIYNASILGLCRIFDYADLPYEKSNDYILRFPESHLENFSEHYLNYLSAQYGHETNYYKMTNGQIVSFLKGIEENIDSEKSVEILNKHIEKVKYWLSSNSYKNVYPFLSEIPFDFLGATKNLKKITLKKDEEISSVQLQVTEQVKLLLEIVEHLKHPIAKRYIIPRVLSYTIIQGFWTNVSFLNSTASKKDMYEAYFHYFIQSAEGFLQEKKDEKKYEKHKLSCATCHNKMKSVSTAFDLTWIQNLGVDGARKSSHYWHHQRDLFICPVCNFVYSCLPLGFTMKNGVGLFINSNHSIRELIVLNQIKLRNVDGEEFSQDQLEEIAYTKIIDEMNQHTQSKMNYEIDNIQIVKFNRHNERRPYTFNLLSREKARQLNDYHKNFHYLTGKFIKENNDYFNLYQEVVQRFYNGQSFSDLLYRLLRLTVDGQFGSTIAAYHILKISNGRLKGGEHYMSDQELKNARISGFKLREVYVGQEAKLNAISYRLLNALKVKNPYRFMETVVQAYSYKRHDKIGIPMIFTQILNNDEKFQSIGYAFLIGLNGVTFEKKEETEGEQVNG